MLLLDRYILKRFFINFAILFALLFLFAVGVDVILNLGDLVKVARAMAGGDAGSAAVGMNLMRLVFDFQAPRLFQFYAYLHGLTAIGAMGFTLAQMHRYRELVAIMASGVSLYRVAMPLFVAVFVLSMAQLVNQELILPRVAPLLLRDYGQVGQRALEQFDVPFTPDSRGTLFQAASFNPQTQTMQWPTILERDAQGRTVRRISATQATWSEKDKAWLLTDGQALLPPSPSGASAPAAAAQPIESYSTDLTPHLLMLRRFNQYASMLSLHQISQMLDMQMITARDSLLRFRYARFSSVLVNLLVLALALPCFLLREPANLLRQSVLCAALAIPAVVGSAIGMMVPLPGVPPAAGVFLPVIVLAFMSLFPWTFFKT